MRFDAKQLQEMSKSVRAWALHALRMAGSGHIGIVLGASNLITTDYANFLTFGSDKFVLSAGHGSALLYSVLKLSGYDIPDLDSFRQAGGLPGHPELGMSGVDAATGPLGQGVGNAVGIAIGEKIKNTDACVYCLCGDGDLSEGVAQESIVLAGHYKLNNLVLIWDDNGISIDGRAIVDVDVCARMLAAGWQVLTIDNSSDFNQIDAILQMARMSKKPVFVQCKNIIGQGARVENTPLAHGFGLTDIELMQLIEQNISPVGDDLWTLVAALNSKPVRRVGAPAIDAQDVAIQSGGADVSTRELSGIYLKSLLNAGVSVIGGSADLSDSTNAKNALHKDIVANDFTGNFINYGVREHAMGAIINGLVSVGVRAYGSSFLAFSDYMKPAIRLAALARIPAIYVFSHDSIAVGQDGPTHQPVEQLATLRLIPNLNVFRPCNGDEVAFAWRAALAETQKPSCIILSRQKFSQYNTPQNADLSKGAYIIMSCLTKKPARITLLSSGADVALACAVAEKIGDAAQVASVLSVADFRRADNKYKQKILQGFVVAIEAASSAPWFEFADAVVGIDDFGISAPQADVYNHFGFDADIIASDILKKLKK